MLDAVLLAEAKDHANWACLSKLVDQVPEGEARSAFAEAVDAVEPQEDEHYGWARDMRDKMISLQVESGPMQAAGATAEAMVAKVKELFGKSG